MKKDVKVKAYKPRWVRLVSTKELLSWTKIKEFSQWEFMMRRAVELEINRRKKLKHAKSPLSTMSR